MANCKSGLGLVHHWLDIKVKEDIYQTLYALLDMDADKTENKEYFRDDTLELGYENEADRIVKEALEEHGYPNDIKSFREIANEVAEYTSNDEYWGECSLSIFAITETKFSIAFAYGGRGQ